MNDLVDGPVSVHVGDALCVLRQLPSESVHCCVTSPPYWQLRDYGAAGQLGLEATPQEYVARLVEIFAEVRRVLRREGTCWLNIGDSYAATALPGGGIRGDAWTEHGMDYRGPRGGKWRPAPAGLKRKDLCLIPERLAIALQDDGWWVRQRIAWCKTAPMPESAEDRPVCAWEHVWLLTKAERYFYDGFAVKEPLSENTHPSGNGYDRNGVRISHGEGNKKGWLPPGAHGVRAADGNGMRMPEKWSNPTGRNMRNYWLLGPEPYPEAHFAVFPSEVPLKAIKAGTSEHGVCPECGAPWERVTASTRLRNGQPAELGAWAKPTDPRRLPATGVGHWRDTTETQTLGWRPTCRHEVAPIPATVLDPFAGSGTTLAVARRLGRRAVGIELQADYLKFIRERIAAKALPLLELLAPGERTSPAHGAESTL